MRAIRFLFFFILCVSLLALPVAAVTGLTGLQNQATVSTAGRCQVNLSLSFHLDNAVEELFFPLPSNAESIRINGSWARTERRDDAIQVAIPTTTAGDFFVMLQYELPMVLSKVNDDYVLQLPLLNRFSYPVSNFSLVLSLPGDVTGRPEFVSGYHQADTDRLLSHSINGNVLTCTALETFKDHETLMMTLVVDGALFPDAMVEKALFSGWDGAALVLAALAILYYLVALLPGLPQRSRCYCAPDGISAGDVGTCLTGCGTDLTMLVMSWAQAGYIQMEMQLKGKVLLHKRMDMGNERSQFEINCFRSLFGTRSTVDGTGYHYAKLCRTLQGKSPLRQQLFLPRSGNPKIFSILCCAAAGCSGISLAVFLTEQAAAQVFLGLLLGILCTAAGYVIQRGGQFLPLRDKGHLLLALGCCGLWLLVGYLSNAEMVFPMVLFQLLAGVAAALGGRRSELGKRSLSQLRGLRRYMLHCDSYELQRLLQANPNYFYELAPYALAMGVDRKFAKRFGKIRLPDCSFLITPLQVDMTPVKWMARLRQAADALNERQKKLPLEKLLGRR
jgi:hypothetical protein